LKRAFYNCRRSKQQLRHLAKRRTEMQSNKTAGGASIWAPESGAAGWRAKSDGVVVWGAIGW
jgi:hypothetical protein